MTGPEALDDSTRRARLRSVKLLSIGVIVLAAVEFLVATIGVQIERLPVRTDFASYYLAGELARERQSPYDAALLAERGRAMGLDYDQFPFLYPPPFAIAMQPLAHFAYPRARQIWMLLGTAALFGALYLLARVMHRQASALQIQSAGVYWIVLAAFVTSALNSTGVHNDVRSGSVGSLLLLAFATLAWTLPERRLWGTAIALAAAALIKLAPGVLLPYAWWRGERRAAALAALLLLLCFVPAVAHWGLQILPDYMRHAILPTLRQPNGWSHNQSLDAYLLRLFDPSAMRAIPARASWPKSLVSVVLSVAIAWQTLRVVSTRHRARTLLPLELGLVVLAMLVLMKITWVHTLTAMLFVWPFLMLAIVHAAERGARWALPAGCAACAGYFLSAAHLPILWGDHLQRVPWNVLTGAHVIGLLILWGATVVVLRHESDVVGSIAPAQRRSLSPPARTLS